MIVKINDTEIVFPSKLTDITLGQRIDFHNEYGKELDAQLKTISEMEDGTLKDLEQTMWQANMACKTFAFFSGIDLKVVQESESLHQIMEVYSVLVDLLSDQAEIERKDKFEWNGEVWMLHEPELKTTSTMTFGEFVDSKQIVQDLHELSAGNWEVMLRMCAIYLRKENEPYHKSFAEPDGDRVELMKQLPMDIAMHVGFFLSNSMNLYLTHLQSLQIPQPNQEGISADTSSSGDGLIS